MTATVLLVQLLSLATACIGFLCYRALTRSRNEFLSSLRAKGKEMKRVRLGPLLWIYLLLTVLITVATVWLFLSLAPA